MEQQEMEHILELIKQRKFGLKLTSYAGLALVTLLAGGVGGYVGAKAENYAMKQDIQDLTEITEQVRTKIADSSWQAQRIWEEKRTVYSHVVKLLDQTNSNLMECDMRAGRVQLNSSKAPVGLLRDLQRQKEIVAEYSQTIAVSGIFLSSDGQEAVESFRRTTGPISHNREAAETTFELAEGNTFSDVCREMRQRAMKSRDAVIAAARKDLAAELGLPLPTK